MFHQAQTRLKGIHLKMQIFYVSIKLFDSENHPVFLSESKESLFSVKKKVVNIINLFPFTFCDDFV